LKKSKKARNFLSKPYYAGGNEAMDAFIKAHLQYPEEAQEARAEGTVKVKLKMDHRGKVIKAEAENQLGYGLEEEAMRVAKLLRFTVEKNRNVRVTFHKKINIHFRLPARPQVQQSIQYNYTYRPAQKPKQPPSKKSYSYTLPGQG
jgi:TonB family protein